MRPEAGFFASLFDFSFSRLITSKVLGLLYAVALFLIALGIILTAIYVIRGWLTAGIIFAVISPILFVFFAIVTRVQLEIVMMVFNVSEDTALLARRYAKEHPPQE